MPIPFSELLIKTNVFVLGLILSCILPRQNVVAILFPSNISISTTLSLCSLESDDTSWPRKLKTTHLKNCIQVTEEIYSGAVPEGEAAMDELKEMGVKTIISVDGMRPQVELAFQRGMRYIHLPHGYEGISDQRLKSLCKAIQQSEKPLYLHCHHGKHRSPAAAAASCYSLGFLTKPQSLKVLTLAGTNPNFKGLVSAVEDASPMSQKDLEAFHYEFKSVAELQPIVESMVAMDEIIDKLTKEITEENGAILKTEVLNSLADQSLLLTELYTELIRNSTPEDVSDEFVALLQSGEKTAFETERKFRNEMRPQKEMVEKLKKNCAECHAKFRDNKAN